MIKTDESALICDLAETYHIYDYRSLPLSRVAIFAAGLRENSRIKMKMSDGKYPIDTMLLASVADRLSIMAWMQSKDGVEGVNQPQSILAQLLGIENISNTEKASDIEAFDTPEDFEKRRNEILRKGGV